MSLLQPRTTLVSVAAAYRTMYEAARLTLPLLPTQVIGQVVRKQAVQQAQKALVSA